MELKKFITFITPHYVNATERGLEREWARCSGN